ncbi:MAG: aminotransferase class V-fold PLP-dependent enzyme, partial [Patescibacteria group bacterium]|nr:aminotransferase class V-fold PLP-dependent enzyme [Patescibacteria group bacterium]
MNRIYFDYAATTPMDPLVKKAMAPYFSDRFGNPGSLHSFGQEAMAMVDESREKIAKAVNADFREIIFTGSATEANNLALRGIVRAARLFSDGTGRSLAPAASAALDLSAARLPSVDQARAASETFRTKTAEPPYRIIISKIEHDSILETARDLERDGIEVIYLPVNKNGLIDLEKLKKSLNERTILVSIMHANNEIGTIQPIAEIAKKRLILINMQMHRFTIKAQEALQNAQD